MSNSVNSKYDHIKRRLEKLITQQDSSLNILMLKYSNFQITAPNQQSLKFDEEIKSLNLLIAFQNQSIQKLKQEKQNLIKINMALKSQIDKKIEDIEKIKESSFLGTNGNQQNDQSFDHSESKINYSTYMMQNNDRFKETSFSFLKFQRNIIDQQSDSDFDPENLCPQLSVLFPDKIQKIIKKRQSSVIPKLNMQKVRTLMKKNRNKIDVQLKKNIHVNPTEKILTLENQLEFTRRQLSKYILECKNLGEIKSKNESYISEIQERNEQLINGYKKLKDNWHKLSKQYFSYRRLYQQCQKIIKSQIKLDGMEHQFNPNLTDFMSNLSEVNTDKKLQNMQQYLTTFLKKVYSLNEEKKIQKCKSEKYI